MTPSRFAVGDRDENEAIICEYLRAAGIEYRKCPEGFGADLLLLVAPMRFVEIKNPARPPSKRRLTTAEGELLTLCEERGIPYDVVLTIEDMQEIMEKEIWART